MSDANAEYVVYRFALREYGLGYESKRSWDDWYKTTTNPDAQAKLIAVGLTKDQARQYVRMSADE